MDKFEYRVDSISGIFKSRLTKLSNLQSLCDSNGKEGWELVNVTYDWLLVSYTLFFKRKTHN
ncbi:hypothetical protein D1819_03130 [Pseudoalteromonas tunicata]|nr:hypothetical protein D1819_03130 [Pseudoalteromonas tunicata]